MVSRTRIPHPDRRRLPRPAFALRGRPGVHVTVSLAAAVALIASAVVVWPAAAASPAISTRASATGFPVGIDIFDVATLGLGDNPTGTITFNLYGPGDPNCSGGITFTTNEAVNGNGTYTSDSYHTLEAGIYQWVARYNGDANNDPVENACGDPNEQVEVARKAVDLTTTPSPSVPVGGLLTDTATLAEGAGPAGPTGTITFNLYGPANLTCTGAAFTDTVTVTGNGQYTSDSFTPTQPGTYQWIADYSGDSNNFPTTGICADLAESVLVTPGGLVTPTLTTTASPSVAVGGQVTDTATLAGGATPTGAIVFTLYGPDNATCAGQPAFTSPPVTVNGNASYTSGLFTPTLPGTYRWRAAYSGDLLNNPVTTPCNAQGESVVVTPGGTTTTSTTSTTTPGATTTTSTTTPGATTTTSTTTPGATTTSTTTTTTTIPTATTTSTTTPGATTTSTTPGATTTSTTPGATTTSTVPGATTTSTTPGATTTSTTPGATTTSTAPGATTTSTTPGGTATTTTSTTSTTTSTTTTVPAVTPAGTTTSTPVSTTLPVSAPSLQANPTQGSPGQSVVLTGSGFGANEPLTATFNTTPVVLATLNASAGGTFSFTVRIPTDAALGGHTFVVAGTSGRSASAAFTVVAPVSTTRPVVTASSPLAWTGSPIRGTLTLAAVSLLLGSAALLWSARRRRS